MTREERTLVGEGTGARTQCLHRVLVGRSRVVLLLAAAKTLDAAFPDACEGVLDLATVAAPGTPASARADTSVSTDLASWFSHFGSQPFGWLMRDERTSSASKYHITLIDEGQRFLRGFYDIVFEREYTFERGIVSVSRSKRERLDTFPDGIDEYGEF